MTNKIQSIVNQGPCRELDRLMQSNVCMFADTIMRVEMFPFNEAWVFCLSGVIYKIRCMHGGALFVSEVIPDDDEGSECW